MPNNKKKQTKDRKKKKKPIVDEYAHIEINKNQRFIVRLAFIGFFAAFCSIIFVQMQSGLQWWVNLPFILLVGFSTLVISSSESWVYRPWQKTAQRVESTRVHKAYKY